MSVYRLRVNDFDLSGISNEVNKWQSHGKYASYDVMRREEGMVSMTLENVFSSDPAFIRYEIHKLGKKGLLGTKKFWIIQLLSGTSSDGPFEKHGCVSAKTLAGAITAAQKDVEWGLRSLVDFDLAVGAMTE